VRRTARTLIVIPVVAALVSCGGDSAEDDPSPTAPATTATPTTTPNPTSSPTEPPDAGIVITLTVSGGEVTGADERVSVPIGSEVTIQVTTDVDDEVHVHGYDLRRDVAAGEQATMTFTADIPGVFEVELEDAGLPLVSLEVQ